MKILIATNAFKGTMGPLAAARAVERAVKRVAPGAQIELFPVSDGGDGLLEAFLFRGRGVRRVLNAPGPVFESVRAEWAISGNAAIIEMAQASGLKYLPKNRLMPLDATTFGVGRLLLAAARSGARSALVGLGGSASNDGGAGCAAGFGFRLLDKNGAPIPPGAKGLLKLERIVPPPFFKKKGGMKIIALTDVDNPLTGPRGSARIYGPQKGAGPAGVAVIERALLHYSRVVKRELGVEIKNIKGGAAAGGLGAGLYAFFGAELVSGADYALRRLGFERALERCDRVITGEGRFDAQSFCGKAPVAVSRLAGRYGKPALLVCGSCTVKDRRRLRANGISEIIALDEVLPLTELAGPPAGVLTKGLLIPGPVLSRFLLLD
ncbi:MAG: glycerate kinase [Elusimicrobiales bacterium]|jgi:glycerate kinase